MSRLVPRIVVTGGAGFIGSHLVDRLLADGAGNVVGFDNLSRGRLDNVAHLASEPAFELIEGDVQDQSAVSQAVRGASLVYHLAAQSTLMGAVRDAEYTFQTNVRGTFNVLRAAVESGVPRVVFTSSRDVYGEAVELPVEEDSPLLAINSYGASKVAGEVYCRAFRREFGLQTVILRLASVYGLRDVGRVIPTWLAQAQAGQQMSVFGGKQVLDFVWVGQVVEALVRAGTFEGPIPPINIGSGTGTRIIDLARRIGRLAECQPKIHLEQARHMEVTRFIADVERMRRILLVEPLLDPLGKLAELVGVPAAVPVAVMG
ncbi:MAG: SDR family NAD(P)-dependent oxidoreductase [Chloroflexota bacterium]